MLHQKDLKIPSHLKSYIVDQNYEHYTPRDHALWRFIMRNTKSFLKTHAHPAFLNGLEMTGIPMDRIPKISEMDEKLSVFGWRAVCVRGFIPPLAFLEFQSSCVMPIAADMRSVEHFDYTPAPDIVHEAAGHAPILADLGYRRYLEKYAVVARRAIFSNQDIRLYEAIRVLSDVKENPDSSPEMIRKAEEDLVTANQSVDWVSEANKITRMYWWTVEYGLIGDVQKPRIYGAGLLSSLGEGRDCLQENTKKIPFNLDCISTTYDITEPQPQLFVTKDFSQLIKVLEEFEGTLAYSIGGVQSLELAKKAQSVTTTCLNSGIEISGQLVDVQQEKGQVTFLRWTGPVQLSQKGQQLEQHGTDRHAEGFSCPIGRWKGVNKSPAELEDKEFASLGLRKDSRCELFFESGFHVSGVLKSWTRGRNGKLLLLTWTDCKVTYGKKTYFEPAWGDFDLAVGDSVPSVYGGPADFESYGNGDFGHSSTQPGRLTPYTEKEKHLFSLYSEVRNLRANPKKEGVVLQLEKLCKEVCRVYSREWLLALEISELMYALDLDSKSYEWFETMYKDVLDLNLYPKSQSRFIESGMNNAKNRVEIL